MASNLIAGVDFGPSRAPESETGFLCPSRGRRARRLDGRRQDASARLTAPVLLWSHTTVPEPASRCGIDPAIIDIVNSAFGQVTASRQ
jgi:hypothetical protein